MTLLLSHWIFLGWVLAVYFAIRQYRQQNTSSLSVQAQALGTALLISLAALQFSYWLRINDLHQAWPFIFYLHQPALYAIGPLLYLYTESLQGQTLTREHIHRHLCPAYVIGAFSLIEWIWRDSDSALTLSPALYCISFGTGALYSSQVLKGLHRFTHPASLIQWEINVIRATIVTGISVVTLALLGTLLNQDWFYPLHGTALSGLMLFCFYIQQRYPGLTHYVVEEMAAEVEHQTRARPALAQVDIAATLAQLRHAMEIDKRYADENLDLPSLAQSLNLGTHQLSHLINEHLGKNYTRFIKEYRIDAAKHLLAQQPDETVLNIALQVGFNSLSSFHAAFKELEGMTPGNYRKQNSPK